MKEFEIKVFAGYTHGGEKYFNAFKEYVEAPSAAAAKKALRAQLKAEGYTNIELAEAIPCK